MAQSQPNIIYHVEANHESDAEDIHMTSQPNNMVDFAAGLQHSEVDLVASENESEREMQKSDDEDELPIQYNNNIGSQPQDDDMATSNSLVPKTTAEGDFGNARSRFDWAPLAMNVPAYDDVHDQRGDILADFDGAHDADDDESISAHEQDNQIDEEIGFDFGSDDPQTNQIISQHLSTPSQQTFRSFNDLLSSHNTPGRGLCKVEQVLKSEQRGTAWLEKRLIELEKERKQFEAALEESRERMNKAYDIVRNAHTIFSQACGAAQIHDDLWKEYEAFCGSLERKVGKRGGWSVTCFENHNGSYVNWEPSLDLFIQSAEMPLGSHNFRCEATTVKSRGRKEYVVEFWVLTNPDPHREIGRTWRQLYPSLYTLAEQAAQQASRGNNLAEELLQSLPNPDLPCSGGWLFEYALEPGRAQHPVLSRRWSYRSAYRIPIDGHQDEDDVMVQPES